MMNNETATTMVSLNLKKEIKNAQVKSIWQVIFLAIVTAVVTVVTFVAIAAGIYFAWDKLYPTRDYLHFFGWYLLLGFIPNLMLLVGISEFFKTKHHKIRKALRHQIRHFKEYDEFHKKFSDVDFIDVD